MKGRSSAWATWSIHMRLFWDIQRGRSGFFRRLASPAKSASTCNSALGHMDLHIIASQEHTQMSGTAPMCISVAQERLRKDICHACFCQ